jgi:tungstate transport system substrate-binding protein
MPADDHEHAGIQASWAGDPPAGGAPDAPLRAGRTRALSRRQILRVTGPVAGTALAAGVLPGCSPARPAAGSGGTRPRAPGTLRLSSVVTVRDGGLWNDLLPAFSRQTGVRVDLAARHDVFGPAREGGADIVYSHYGHQDLHSFVTDGYGLWPRTVLFNLVCLLGPPHDPAGVRGLGDLGQAFARIARAGASFEVNNIPELVYLAEVVLQAAGVSPGTWYASHRLSGADAVTRASDRGAYTLWGVTPFLDIAQHLHLEPLVTDDPILQRIMVTVVVNPGKVPGVNTSAANAFQSYLLSSATQARIRAFRNQALGRPIFFPAGRDNEDALLLGKEAGSSSSGETRTRTGHGKNR